MSSIECDVAVIGAGTAGLAAERSARAAGARTLLIDDRFAGTTCATVGCMPSKLLIAAAHAAHAVRRAGVFGIRVAPPVVDGRAVMDRVRAQRDAFVAATLASIDQIPAGIRVRATARFVDRSTLALDDGSSVRAKAVVIATGSRPTVPHGFDALGDRMLTNETVFELPDLPRSIAVIGAGPLGLELAQAFARLGVATAVFGQGTALAGLRDPDVSAALQAILAQEMALHLGVEPTAVLDERGDGGGDDGGLDRARDHDHGNANANVNGNGNGSGSSNGNGNANDGNRRGAGQGHRGGVLVSWTGASHGTERYERVLVAAGRAPQLGRLRLDATGLECDKHGTPRHDSHTLQCGDAPIFIVGDADGQRAVLHDASAEGAIAGSNAAAYPNVRPARRTVPFAITFTDPPVAVIGPPPPDDAVIGVAAYDDQGRAKVEDCNAGLARLYAAAPDGRLTGAAMACPGADHLGHLIAWSIEQGVTATDLLTRPFYHPTFEEGLKPALRAICKAVHAPVAQGTDQGTPPGA